MQETLRFPAPEALYAGGCLFTAANKVCRIVLTVRQKQVEQVGTVVDDDMRLACESLFPKSDRVFRITPMDRVDFDAIVDEGRADSVLRRERIGAGDMHFSSAPRQGLCQVGRLRLQVDAK